MQVEIRAEGDAVDEPMPSETAAAVPVVRCARGECERDVSCGQCSGGDCDRRSDGGRTELMAIGGTEVARWRC